MRTLLILAVLAVIVMWALLVGGTVDDQPAVKPAPVVRAESVFDPPPVIVTTSSTSSSTTTSTTTPRARTAPTEPSAGGHPCGPAYDLPPCSVMMRESGGNPNAYNPHGCGGRGCYGKWQCDPKTCSGRGTEAQQDAEARALWDGGRGCAHWDACAA